jgi:hypothetical protein
MLEAKANTGSGLDKLATDLVAGEHIPLNKLVTGALGVNGGPVTPTNGLPVDLRFDSSGVGVSTATPLPVTLANQGGPGNPIYVQPPSGDSAPTRSFTALVQGTTVLSPSNTLPVGVSFGGGVVSTANPFPIDILKGGVVNSAANPLVSQLALGGTLASAANPVPSQLSLNNALVSDANALPTRNHTEVVTVQAGMTGTLHQDLLTATIGGWLDTNGNAEVTVTMVTTGTFTTGAIQFEQSNDPTVLVGVGTLVPFDEPSGSSRNLTTLTLSAATRHFRFSPSARYVRCRVSTAITGGGTVATRIYMRDIPAIPSAPATQPVSGTVAVSGTVTANATPVSVVGAVLDASLARTVTGVGATGANGSGSGIIVYTNITAIAGTTPTLALNLQVQDPVSAAWVNLPGTTFPTRTATGLFATVVYPGAIAATDIINMGVPRVYRLAWTIGGTTPSFTFSTAVASLL